jgi:homoserine O-acetyltransferase
MGALALGVRVAAEQDFALPIPRDFRLASGEALPDARISLRCLGAPDALQIVTLGGISAGRDVCGDGGWWRETFIGHGGVDLRRYGVIGFDFAPVADARVRLAPADQARLIALALDALGIRRLHGFIGASYGGLVGLAFAALAPERLARLCVISAAHRPAAQALAWRGVQRRMVEFGAAQGDAAAGLALARQLAMITYRTPEEFEQRFGVGLDGEGRGAVDRYLESRGEAYAGAMAVNRWLTLSEAIDRAFVDPAGVRARTTLVASLNDQLVPHSLMRELAEQLPDLRGLYTLPSLYGHDAFLKEPARLAPILSRFLEDDSHD